MVFMAPSLILMVCLLSCLGLVSCLLLVYYLVCHWVQPLRFNLSCTVVLVVGCTIIALDLLSNGRGQSARYSDGSFGNIRRFSALYSGGSTSNGRHPRMCYGGRSSVITPTGDLEEPTARVGIDK